MSNRQNSKWRLGHKLKWGSNNFMKVNSLSLEENRKFRQWQKKQQQFKDKLMVQCANQNSELLDGLDI